MKNKVFSFTFLLCCYILLVNIMNCLNCGFKNPKNVRYCAQCGNNPNVRQIPSINAETDGYYGKDWKKVRFFSFLHISDVDIMIHNKHLYIIKLPKKQWNILLFILGLVLFNLIGWWLVSAYLNKKDEEARYNLRLEWLNEYGQLISNKYNSYIIFEAPLVNIIHKVIRKKTSFTITDDTGASVMSFANTKTNCQQLYNFLDNHAL